MYRNGDLVIYTVSKRNRRPAKTAKKVYPAAKGEEYLSEIDKFWVVTEVRADGQLVVKTRRGKERLVAAADPNLRRAAWWERLVHAHKFPHPAVRAATADAGSPPEPPPAQP